MDHFSTLLASRLQKHKLSQEAYASLILEKTKQIIENHFGERAIQNLIPYKYFEKKIYIKATNSVWRQSLFPYQKSFLLLIQKDFPAEKIQKIIIL